MGRPEETLEDLLRPGLRAVCVGINPSRAMIGLRPVRPIRELNTDDARFIEACDVLDGLEAGQNLMMMEWQDFEILVRDLFEQMFQGRGGEFKVTRTSRDQGVDAVGLGSRPLGRRQDAATASLASSTCAAAGATLSTRSLRWAGSVAAYVLRRKDSPACLGGGMTPFGRKR